MRQANPGASGLVRAFPAKSLLILTHTNLLPNLYDMKSSSTITSKPLLSNSSLSMLYCLSPGTILNSLPVNGVVIIK